MRRSKRLQQKQQLQEKGEDTITIIPLVRHVNNDNTCKLNAMSAAVLQSLVQTGYAPIHYNYDVAATRPSVKSRKHLFRTGRTCRPAASKRDALRIVGAMLQPCGWVLDVVDEYLERRWSLTTVEYIDVQEKAPAQELHRDHSGPPGVACCVAVSFAPEPSALRTRIVPGSHRWSGARVHNRLPAVPVTTRAMVYDPRVIHGGGANPGNAEELCRVFCTFVSTIKTDAAAVFDNAGYASAGIARRVVLTCVRSKPADLGAHWQSSGGS